MQGAADKLKSHVVVQQSYEYSLKINISSRDTCLSLRPELSFARAVTFVVAQPSMVAPPAGPPRSWSGNGTGVLGAPPSGGGPNGQQQLQQQAYGAPPSFAPPMGPPSSGNGIGAGSNGGPGRYGGEASMPRVASTPMGLYGASGSRGVAPPMSAHGQVRAASWHLEGSQVAHGFGFGQWSVCSAGSRPLIG